MTLAFSQPMARRATANAACADDAAVPRDREIFVWLLDLPSLPLASMLEFTTDAERGADIRRRYRTDFEPWLKSRAALRHILSAVTGQSARRTAIATGQDGKPELADNPDGLYFNASRSRDFALIALARTPVGVDIEAVRPEFTWRTVAMHWFHPRERALLASAPEARRVDLFFQIWTHKEAYFKGVGLGLNREAMVACFTGPGHRSLRGPKGSQASQWRLKPLDAPPAYKASLASAAAAPIIVDRTSSFAEALRLHS
jgi:4'-phosphopantetheinyl transferase